MLLQFRNALMVFVVMTVITGVLYPLAVTGLGHVLFADAATGSVIERNGKAVGSKLIGQAFTEPGYFWSRPSSTSAQPYDGAASTGSNLSPSNPAQVEAVTARVAALRTADPGNTAPVPADLVTASGSGLDPHISPAAAGYQAARVARARGLDVAQIRALVERHTEGRTFGLLGEPRVNVLELNLALDGGG
ncbi:MAG: potassium-transporting ATPase subunit KdpC [Steroidobacteraceae bacterium]